MSDKERGERTHDGTTNLIEGNTNVRMSAEVGAADADVRHVEVREVLAQMRHKLHDAGEEVLVLQRGPEGRRRVMELEVEEPQSSGSKCLEGRHLDWRRTRRNVLPLVVIIDPVDHFQGWEEVVEAEGDALHEEGGELGTKQLMGGPQRPHTGTDEEEAA